MRLSRWLHGAGIAGLIGCLILIAGYPILLGIEGISFGNRIVGPGYIAALVGLTVVALLALGLSWYVDPATQTDIETRLPKRDK